MALTDPSPKGRTWTGALTGMASGGGAPVISLGFVLLIWSAVAHSGAIPETIFPSPWATWAATVEMWQNGTLPKDLRVSLSRAAIGFGLGASLGIFLGLMTGRIVVVRTLLNPFLNLLRPIPAIALVPVAIVWFGIGEGSKYFVVSYTVFLTVWFNTHHGMQYVPETYLRAARSLGASRFREFATVIIPAAAPHIFAGIRLVLRLLS